MSARQIISHDQMAMIEKARAQVRLQAEALSGLEEQLDDSFIEVVERVMGTRGKIVTTGSGTSGIMAERLAHLLSVCGTPSFYLGCLDALHGGMGAITPSDMVIALSKGGQSTELSQLVSRLVERGIQVIAVTERSDSLFARNATMVVHLRTEPHDADPGGLIAMGSTLVMGAWGDALAKVLMDARRYSWDEVIDSHPGGAIGQQPGRLGKTTESDSSGNRPS